MRIAFYYLALSGDKNETVNLLGYARRIYNNWYRDDIDTVKRKRIERAIKFLKSKSSYINYTYSEKAIKELLPQKYSWLRSMKLEWDLELMEGSMREYYEGYIKRHPEEFDSSLSFD